MILTIKYRIKEILHEFVIKSIQKYCRRERISMYIKKEDVIKKIFRKNRISVEIEFYGEQSKLTKFKEWFDNFSIAMN
jgi:hypothetical protein